MAQPGETTGTMGDEAFGAPSLGERIEDAAATATHTFKEARDAASDTVRHAADYLRDTEMDRMAADVEAMVKRHPGPALITAGVLGFLLGRALSR